MTTLVTIECARPGDRYTVFESGPVLDVHLAAPGEHGGTGPCLCGFDRHAANVGFSVGGGVTGPRHSHVPCPECARLIDGRPIKGLHAALFRKPVEVLDPAEVDLAESLPTGWTPTGTGWIYRP